LHPCNTNINIRIALFTMTDVTASMNNEPHPHAHVPMLNTKDERGGGGGEAAADNAAAVCSPTTASMLVAADGQNFNNNNTNVNVNNNNVHNPNDYTIMMMVFLRWIISWMGTMFKALLFGRDGVGRAGHDNGTTQTRDNGNNDRLRCRLGDTGTNLAQLAMTSTLEPRPYTCTNSNTSYDEEERSHRGSHAGHGHTNIDSSPRNNKIHNDNDNHSSDDDDDDDDESSFDRYNTPVKGHFDHSITTPNHGTYQQVSPYRDDDDDDVSRTSRSRRSNTTSSSDGDSSQRRIGELRYLNSDYGSENSDGEYPHANYYNDNFSSSEDDESHDDSSFEGGGGGDGYDDSGHIILQASHSHHNHNSDVHSNNNEEQEEGYEVQLPPDFQHGVVYVPHAHAHGDVLSPQSRTSTSSSHHQAQDTTCTMIPTGSYQTHLPSDSNICSTELSRMLQAQHWSNAVQYCCQNGGGNGGKFKERDVRTKVDVHILKLGKCQTLPLHLACLYQPPVQVVQALVDLYPDAASVRVQEEACNQLPLHLACMLGGSKDVIQVLLDAYPLGVKCRESFGGFLPLHLAVHSTTTSTSYLEAIETLIQAFPESLHVVCNFGDTPLDIVQKSGNNNNLKDKHKVKALLQSYLDKLPPPIQVRHLIQDIDDTDIDNNGNGTTTNSRVGGGSRIHIFGVMTFQHLFPNKHVVPSFIQNSSTKTVETYVTLSILPASSASALGPSTSTSSAPAPEGETKEWYVIHEVSIWVQYIYFLISSHC
jgi:hypothetical protein